MQLRFHKLTSSFHHTKKDPLGSVLEVLLRKFCSLWSKTNCASVKRFITLASVAIASLAK